MLHRYTALVGAFTPMLAAAAVPAQDHTEPSLLLYESAAQPQTELDTTPKREVEYSLLGYGVYQFNTDLSANQFGDVNVYRVGSVLNASIPQDARGAWGVLFGAEYSRYEWKEPTINPGPVADPFDRVFGLILGGKYEYQFNRDWFGWAGAAITSWGEDRAQFSETITGGVQLGGGYTFNEDFNLGLWVSVASELEETANVFVFPIIDWQIDDHWSMGTRPIGLRGGLFDLTYDINPSWAVVADLSYQQRTFRLDNDAYAPGGAARDILVPANIGVRWTPEGHDVELLGQIGIQLYQEYRVQDAAGNVLNTFETQVTPIFSLFFRWNF